MRFKKLERADPLRIFHVLRENKYPFILESAEKDSRKARYTYISSNPDFIVEVGEKGTYVDGERVCEEKNVFRALKNFEINAEGERFSGGFVGYISYDSVLHEIGGRVEKSSVFGHYSSFFVYDHMENALYYCGDDFDNAERIAEKARKVEIEREEVESSILKTDAEKEEFERDVERAKKHVFDGDVFQIVISRKYELKFDGDPFQAYLNLRELNSSPYMFYLEFDKTLAGSSPETLASVFSGVLKVNPIAGTAKRGKNDDEDRLIAEKLLNDEKERAEHIMLVDLARNDVRKVCKAGSVRVERFMDVLKYSHVMHIESEVLGVLEENKDVYDAISACFPAGTLTGAPKIRAIELIDEIERSKRGIYGGAIGYFSKDADFAIAIRMAEVDGNTANIRAGAGIVADSNPENEFYETERKMRALLEAFGVVR